MGIKYLIFSDVSCSPCKSLKAWLGTQGIEHEEVDVVERYQLTRQYGIRGGLPISIKLKEGKESGRLSGFNINEAKLFFGV
jgi:hypothetical protein